MADGIKTEVTINELALQNKLEALIKDESVMTEVHEKFAETIFPYVPYDTGRLSEQDVRVDATGVTYYAPYAAKNYYGDDINHKKEKHPLATSHWDEVAMQTKKEEFAKEVEDILKRKAKELNG